MEIFIISFLWSTLLGISIYGLYVLNRDFYIIIRKYIFRDRIIVIEGVSSAIKGEFWKSPVIITPSGKTIAYRYPEHKAGTVELNQNGTGYFCGQVIWKDDK